MCVLKYVCECLSVCVGGGLCVICACTSFPRLCACLYVCVRRVSVCMCVFADACEFVNVYSMSTQKVR